MILFGLGLLALPAMAQDFPQAGRPILAISGFPAGTTNEIYLRLI